ncbi:MAG: hypothetical protein IJ812_06660 [Schwartzia sp.]|nr:hypothetical protein [Schwartzia sp. (in: firmicutes)]MBR1886072.1 hypothetical protein [Schwartzia sp. (in: firmicutes)]
MKGRVERVSPVQSVSFDIARSFEDRRGFANHNGGQSFRQMLDKAMQTAKKPLASAVDRPQSDAYVLNVTQPTHSLFYKVGLTLEGLEKLAHE